MKKKMKGTKPTSSSSAADLKKSLLSRVLKSDPTMRALMWLAEHGKDARSDADHADSGAIDYERIIQLMQNVSDLLILSIAVYPYIH
jgi:hypothetical protein